MKKYLAMAMIAAGVSAVATAAPTPVTVVTGTATAVSTGTAGQYTLSGDAGAVAGAKFFADATAQGGSYVKVAFTVTGGNNVASYVLNTASQFSATATSLKGNQVFGGNTTSGAVKLIGACASTAACAASDAQTAMTTASSM